LNDKHEVMSFGKYNISTHTLRQSRQTTGSIKCTFELTSMRMLYVVIHH